MTKNADFKKTKIYRLCCNNLSVPYQYIGHTTNFNKRKAVHKYDCNTKDKPKYNQKVYQIIRENGGWKSWSMILVENYPCNNNLEASQRERYWFEKLNANMNTRLPYRSEEDLKQYYVDNKEKIREYQKGKAKEYYQKKKQQQEEVIPLQPEYISVEQQDYASYDLPDELFLEGLDCSSLDKR